MVKVINQNTFKVLDAFESTSYLGCFPHSRLQWFVFFVGLQCDLRKAKYINTSFCIHFFHKSVVCFVSFTSWQHPSTVSTCSTFTWGMNSARLKEINYFKTYSKAFQDSEKSISADRSVLSINADRESRSHDVKYMTLFSVRGKTSSPKRLHRSGSILGCPKKTVK